VITAAFEKENDVISRATISDVARAIGVNKSTVGRQVAKLEQSGRITIHNGPNREKRIDLAQYAKESGVDAAVLSASLPNRTVHLASHGWLGPEADARRRVRAAEAYIELCRQSDHAALAHLVALRHDLGSADSDLLRSILVENRTTTEIARSESRPVSFLNQRLALALDVCARHFSTRVLRSQNKWPYAAHR
jgi:DNA-binding Lrp family transcriptional regulator